MPDKKGLREFIWRTWSKLEHGATGNMFG